jgi:hypothetical protein
MIQTANNTQHTANTMNIQTTQSRVTMHKHHALDKREQQAEGTGSMGAGAGRTRTGVGRGGHSITRAGCIAGHQHQGMGCGCAVLCARAEALYILYTICRRGYTSSTSWDMGYGCALGARGPRSTGSTGSTTPHNGPRGATGHGLRARARAPGPSPPFALCYMYLGTRLELLIGFRFGTTTHHSSPRITTHCHPLPPITTHYHPPPITHPLPLPPITHPFITTHYLGIIPHYLGGTRRG